MTTNVYREALDQAIQRLTFEWGTDQTTSIDALKAIREAIDLDLLTEETLDEVAADSPRSVFEA